MNREIEFRGQRIIDKQWVFGYLVVDQDGTCFIVNNCGGSYTWEPVWLETVGQFTGLLDKNGKKIYEGDIVSIIEQKGNWAYSTNPEKSKYISWENRYNQIVEPTISSWQLISYLSRNTDCAVAGNIYDNQNLLAAK